MDYLQQLLKDQKVEWKKLGEVCRIKNGRDYKHLGEGNIPVYGSGGIMRYVDTFVYDKPTVLIPRKGSLKNLFYLDSPFWNVDTIFYTEIDTNQILPKFLYHFLTTQNLEKLNMAGGVPSLTQTMLNKLPIPLPPLSVQSRIVEILDKFTALEAELEAELELRKKQYQHYREQLLNFSSTPPHEFNVIWRKLGEVFHTCNGYTPSKDNPEYWEGGTIPWYRMEDIRENGRMLNDALQHITPKGVKRNGLFKANSIILATSATIGEHAMLTTDALANQRFTNFAIKENFKELLLPKFAFYYFYVIDDWCKQNIYVGNFPSVDVDKLKKVDFPLPPLSVQSRIVEILDKFDALTNSITEGLPLEIKLRRQQYEYYREQLLDFRGSATL